MLSLSTRPQPYLEGVACSPHHRAGVSLEGELQRIVRGKDWLMAALAAVRDCELPDWYIGGGVVRSLVWDHLHGYAVPTPLADVDVVFCDPLDLTPGREAAVEEALDDRLPGLPWEATNQAAVHLWYADVFGRRVAPLTSTAAAIATWPETATCVGLRLLGSGDLRICAPYGLQDLFGMVLRHNPRRASVQEFQRRAWEKQITRRWPRVMIIEPDDPPQATERLIA